MPSAIGVLPRPTARGRIRVFPGHCHVRPVLKVMAVGKGYVVRADKSRLRGNLS